MEAETQPVTGTTDPSVASTHVRDGASIPKTALQPTAREHLRRIAQERPLRIGILSGLGYRNVKGSLEKTSALLRTLPDIPHHVVESPEEVSTTLEAYEAANVDILGVSGGDGTVSMVATHLLTRSKSPTPPLVAILRGGRTNMTASDVGMKGNQVRALKRLLAWTESPDIDGVSLVERPSIGVGAPGHAPSCGFFVGGGAIYQGSLDTWRFRDGSKVPGMRTGFGTTASVVKLVSKHVWSRSAFAPTEATVTVDGKDLEERSWCFFMATTLNRLALGIDPFWGGNEQPIRMTAIAQNHKKLLRAGLVGVWGKRGRHLTERNGYYGVSGRRIHLVLPDGGVTLDGEIVNPVGNELRMGIAGNLTFIRP